MFAVKTCPLITQYQHDYHKHAINRVKSIKPVQTDKAIISGYADKNLQINGKRLKTKVWPQVTLNYEEYEKFLKRLGCCKKEIFKMYYSCKCVDFDYIESLLNCMEKTVYQCSYSSKDYWPRHENRRFNKIVQKDTNFKYYDTIYQVYYNRIQDLEHFRKVMKGEIIRQRDYNALRKDVKKLYKPAGTTYFMDLCLPAIFIGKKPKNRTQPGPIDRYTLRRL